MLERLQSIAEVVEEFAGPVTLLDPQAALVDQTRDLVLRELD